MTDLDRAEEALASGDTEAALVALLAYAERAGETGDGDLARWDALLSTLDLGD